MNTFNSLFRLTEIIEAAETHCIFLGHRLNAGYHDRMLPVVLVNYEHALNIPAYESIPETTVNRIHYVQKFLTVFRYGNELCGEEGKGMYGIGMYKERAGGSWHCDSILFNESSHEPLLVEGRDAALKVATEEARSRDKSSVRGNESAVLEHGLIEASILNALLGALMRAKSETVPATIGIRARKLQVLLEGEDRDGRPLSVPEAGFVCRDEAAGMILGEIVCVADNARRALRHELERKHISGLAVV